MEANEVLALALDDPLDPFSIAQKLTLVIGGDKYMSPSDYIHMEHARYTFDPDEKKDFNEKRTKRQVFLNIQKQQMLALRNVWREKHRLARLERIYEAMFTQNMKLRVALAMTKQTHILVCDKNLVIGVGMNKFSSNCIYPNTGKRTSWESLSKIYDLRHANNSR